jgi:hypothetical protein
MQVSYVQSGMERSNDSELGCGNYESCDACGLPHLLCQKLSLVW